MLGRIPEPERFAGLIQQFAALTNTSNMHGEVKRFFPSYFVPWVLIKDELTLKRHNGPLNNSLHYVVLK